VEDGSKVVRAGWLIIVCRFNALVSPREGKRHDEALPKDEAKVASSSWLIGKEA
jgi:hypothetical protein